MQKRHHPFWKRDLDFKYIYCFGLGVMSMGHMKSITETQDFFDDLLENIALPGNLRQQILVDINNSFETRIDEVFTGLRTKEEQYCFVLDLYSILRFTSWGRKYCENILEDYLQIFQFSMVERRFFEEFSMAMHRGNIEHAAMAYQEFTAQGYGIRYDFLTWFDPSFSMNEQYKDITVAPGDTVLLDKPSVIAGDIVVKRGGSLLIYGADIQMSGSITVDGGRIKIDHGNIRVTSCRKAYWLEIQDASVVTITDTMIDCQGKCGIISQNSGRLIMEECWLRHTDRVRAIHFTGQSVKITHTHFLDGKAGFLELGGAAQAKVCQCDFRTGVGEYGGAVYSDSIGEVLLQQCEFFRCQAKYLGAAVYFKTQKLGQTVDACVCQDSVPPGNEFFNVLENMND